MRAVGIMVHGGPEVLKVLTVAAVHAGPGDVRVRVHAAAVNPTDTMARNGSRAASRRSTHPPMFRPVRKAPTRLRVDSGCDAASLLHQTSARPHPAKPAAAMPSSGMPSASCGASQGKA